MDVPTLLTELARRGVRLWAQGRRLRFRAPRGALLAGHRAALQRHKADVLRVLAERPDDFLPTYPISVGQRALWFEQRLEPGSHAYNIHLCLRFLEEVDVDLLQRALEALFERHPVLRSSFPEVGGAPARRAPGRAAALEIVDASTWSAEDFRARLERDALTPFDLTSEPATRARLFRRSRGGSVLLLTTHHIAIDFTSYAVMVEDLDECLRAAVAGEAPRLPPLELDFSEFVDWQNALLASPEGDRLQAWWSERLGHDPEPVSLALDRPRRGGAPRGASAPFRLSPALSARLKALAVTRGTTLYTLLTAAFQGFLHLLTGQRRFVLGSPMAGRGRPEFERLVSFFSNMVLLRARLSADLSFGDHLAKVHREVLEAIEHQEYPLPLLYERLRLEGIHRPLVSVVFAFWSSWVDRRGLAPLSMGFEGLEVNLGGARAEVISLPAQEGQFDLTVVLFEHDARISGRFLYRSDLFDRETVAHWMSDYETFLTRMADDPDRSLAEMLPLDRTAAGALAPDAAEVFEFS